MAEDTPNTPQENELQTPEALQALKEKLKAEVLNEAKAENRKHSLQLLMGLLIGLGLGIAISFYWDTIGGWHNILLGTIVIAILLIGGLLYFILFFRSTILAKVFGVAKASYEDIFSTLYQPTKTLVQKNMPEATYEQKVDPYLGAIEKGARQLIAYQSFRRTRRFLFGLFISLVIGLGGIIGTILLLRQNELVGKQNILLTNQNTLLTTQNQLVEGQRRSSLIFMMSNIMDKVDEEIRVQKDEIRKKLRGAKEIDKIADPIILLGNIQSIENTIDSLKWRLSSSVIARIAALSQAFKPHQYLDADTLSTALSPERGQLLQALAKSNFDSNTYAKIYQEATFRQADLKGADLEGANLKGVDLNDADLKGVNLKGSDLRGAFMWRTDLGFSLLQNADFSDANVPMGYFQFANLSGANLSNANLWRSDFTEANLSNANLQNVDLRGAILDTANLEDAELDGADLWGADLTIAFNVSTEQLLSTSSLFKVINLTDSLRHIIQLTKPKLFEKQVEDE